MSIKYLILMLSIWIGIALVITNSGILYKDIVRTPNLPKYGDIRGQPIGRKAVIKLAIEGSSFCTGFVIDKNYAMTAEHCISKNNSLIEDDIEILDETNKFTGVIAKAVVINNRVDVGLIKGDFSKFPRLVVDFYLFESFSLTSEGGPRTFDACGFPYGQNYLTCVDFEPLGNDAFFIIGKGFAIPGMSGGPVIDYFTGKVIGVNSSMGQGYFYVAPTLGALGAFGIEPFRRTK